MRSSTLLAVLGAALVIASPVHQALHKRAYVTNVITDIVYVTVTAGPQPFTKLDSPPAYPHFNPKPKKTYSPRPTPSSSTSPPPPPPPPATYAPPETPSPAPVPSPAPAVTYPAPQSAAPAPAPAGDSYPTDYKSTCLHHHNKHRDNHTAHHLQWDDILAGYAEISAKTCVFAHDMTQGGGGYGQNIAASGSTEKLGPASSYVADSITNQWYNGEIANMPYGQDSPPTQGVPEYLHLSQIVWKDTTHVGCFSAECAAGTVFSYPSSYTVCNYKTPGNILGSFISQVSRPIGLPGMTA
ncbi:hypothetical protein B2J93_6641 [Marssonina coronariae]|uniref:SCP domain-containing protein n=1 Tax=Diplocarpon coronariae TaxID=2795749 RepID=A0A218Z631_9HELO|nr:hypothetical protein B2J93_6641 [Marssonina coronariae]